MTVFREPHNCRRSHSEQSLFFPDEHSLRIPNQGNFLKIFLSRDVIFTFVPNMVSHAH